MQVFQTSLWGEKLPIEAEMRSKSLNYQKFRKQHAKGIGIMSDKGKLKIKSDTLLIVQSPNFYWSTPTPLDLESLYEYFYQISKH